MKITYWPIYIFKVNIIDWWCSNKNMVITSSDSSAPDESWESWEISTCLERLIWWRNFAKKYFLIKNWILMSDVKVSSYIIIWHDRIQRETFIYYFFVFRNKPFCVSSLSLVLSGKLVSDINKKNILDVFYNLVTFIDRHLLFMPLEIF